MAASTSSLYLRPNLSSTGTVPMQGPFELCPDVIGASKPVDDPQETFAAPASWKEAYAVAPWYGSTNYYYVRAGNTAAQEARGSLSLYWAEAQLIAWPELWSANLLVDQNGASAVPASAPAHGVGVGAEPLLLVDPPLPEDADAYLTFVAQVSKGKAPTPPEASTLLEMSALLTSRPDLGFRNTESIEADENEWRRVLTLQVAKSVAEAVPLTISVQGTGLVGATVSLGSSSPEIQLHATEFTQNGQVIGLNATVEPGASFELEMQLWNTTGVPLAPGYAVSLGVDFPIPPSQLTEAAALGVVDGRRSRLLANAGINPPQPMAPLGAATFLGV